MKASANSKAVQIKWITPPSALQQAIQKYGDVVMVKVRAIADFIAIKAQDDMRLNARWTDRTGRARGGLFSIAETAAKDMVVIYLSHGQSVWYGIYLETSHGMAYAIIMPTVQKYLPVLEQMLKELVS